MAALVTSAVQEQTQQWEETRNCLTMASKQLEAKFELQQNLMNAKQDEMANALFKKQQEHSSSSLDHLIAIKEELVRARQQRNVVNGAAKTLHTKPLEIEDVRSDILIEERPGVGSGILNAFSRRTSAQELPEPAAPEGPAEVARLTTEPSGTEHGVDEPRTRNAIVDAGDEPNQSEQVKRSGKDEGVSEPANWDRTESCKFDVTKSPQAPRRTCSAALFSLIVILQGTVVMMIVALSVFPFLTLAMLGISMLWLLYLSGEEPVIQLLNAKIVCGGPLRGKFLRPLDGLLRQIKMLRSSHDKENKLKAVMYSVCVCTIVFNPDVSVLPTYVAGLDPFQAMLVLAFAGFGTTYLAHAVVYSLHERHLRGGNTNGIPVKGSQAVQKIMGDIRRILKDQNKKRRANLVINVLAQTDESILSELLETMYTSPDCSLQLMISQVKDARHRQFRSELVEQLVERSEYLSVKAKSMLLHTLMQLRLSSCSSGEDAVEKLLTGTYGDDLSELKSIQDSLGDIQSMHKLIFQDVTDLGIRSRILDHFLSEGLLQVAHRTLMTSGHFRHMLNLGRRAQCVPESLHFVRDGASRGPNDGGRCGPWRKILTDVDDTMECSGGRFPAGIDERYFKHTPYPGVTAFYRELQGGGEVGQLVALSARPHIAGDFMERGAFKKFERLKDLHGLHTMPGLLTGSIDTGMQFVLSGELAALGQKKFESFKEFVALYPEFRMIFLGDNGQADYAVGQQLCRHFPDNVEQVYIHEVQPREKTFGFIPNVDAPIDFFEDYIMCAVQAATRPAPLISPQGLRNVVTSALDDFRKITTWNKEGDRDVQAKHLNRSALCAIEVLKELGVSDDLEVELLELPPPRPPLDGGEVVLYSSGTEDGGSQQMSRKSLRGLARRALGHPRGRTSPSSCSSAAPSRQDVGVSDHCDNSVQTDADLPEEGYTSAPLGAPEVPAESGSTIMHFLRQRTTPSSSFGASGDIADDKDGDEVQGRLKGQNSEELIGTDAQQSSASNPSVSGPQKSRDRGLSTCVEESGLASARPASPQLTFASGAMSLLGLDRVFATTAKVETQVSLEAGDAETEEVLNAMDAAPDATPQAPSLDTVDEATLTPEVLAILERAKEAERKLQEMMKLQEAEAQREAQRVEAEKDLAKREEDLKKRIAVIDSVLTPRSCVADPILIPGLSPPGSASTTAPPTAQMTPRGEHREVSPVLSERRGESSAEDDRDDAVSLQDSVIAPVGQQD